jgi:inosose dehydratase
MNVPRVASAPLSYGAFEITVGTDFVVPEPGAVLAAMSDAGYAGTELGPPGYLGTGAALREILEARRLQLVGGFVPIRFSEAEHWEDGFAGLTRTLDIFSSAGATSARPVLSDAGGPERLANPGRGGEDVSLRLSDARWRRLIEGVNRAQELAVERGFEPVFHHHTATYVEGIPEIERFLADTTVPLLLDTGHLALAGGDPVAALRDWASRVEAIHLKDVRMDVLDSVRVERAGMLAAWRRGIFCALGDGNVDLIGFCAALRAAEYDGWIVVEQDRVLQDGASFAASCADQARNREWLRDNGGW